MTKVADEQTLELDHCLFPGGGVHVWITHVAEVEKLVPRALVLERREPYIPCVVNLLIEMIFSQSIEPCP